LALGALGMWGLLALLGRGVKDNTEDVTRIQTLLDGRDRELRDRETELGNLRAQMKNIEGEFGSLKTSREKLELDLKAADKRAADASARLVTVENDLKASNTARIKFEDDLKRKDGELSAAGAKLTSALGDFDKAKLTTAAQIAALTAGAATAAAVIKGKDAKIAELEGKIKAGEGDWSAKFSAKDKEIEDYKLRIGKLEGAVKEGGDFKIRYDKDIADLRAQLSTAKTAAAAELAALTAGGAAAAATIKSKDTKIAELEARIKALDGDLAARNKDLGDYKLRFEKADTDLKASVSTKDKELADWKARYAKLEGDWKAGASGKDKELADLRAQLSTAKTAAAAELAALTAGAATAAAAIKSKDAKIAELEARTKTLDGDLGACSREREDLRKRVAVVQDEANKAKSVAAAELAALTAGAATAAATIKSRDSRIVELEKRLAASEADLNAARGKDKALADAQAEIASLRASNAKSVSDWEARLVARDAEWKAKLETSTSQLADTRLKLVDAEKARDTITNAASKLGIKAVVSSCPQHLSDIHGIGTVFESRLFAHGIGTFFEVAHLTNEDMTRMLEITDDMLKSVNFDGIRMDAMKLAEETQTVGRTWSGEEPDDFEPIDGIGHVFEKRLYDAGICTYEALLNTSEDKIMEIISRGKKMVTPPNIGYWMAQTKKLLEAKQGKK
jgi:predicted flap endonuclease-1-like 5' DNA nuclease